MIQTNTKKAIRSFTAPSLLGKREAITVGAPSQSDDFTCTAPHRVHAPFIVLRLESELPRG
jgi:hypothetical protein